MLRVRFSEKSKQLIVNKHFEKNYFELIDTQAIDIFLSNKYQYVIVDENEPADICIIGIQHNDNSLLKKMNIIFFYQLKIFLLVELIIIIGINLAVFLIVSLINIFIMIFHIQKIILFQLYIVGLSILILFMIILKILEMQFLMKTKNFVYLYQKID